MSKDLKKDTSKKKKKNGHAASAPTFNARVFVTLKPTVNDPEGITIGNALGSLGFDAVTGVRSGRYFQLTLPSPSTLTLRF